MKLVSFTDFVLFSRRSTTGVFCFLLVQYETADGFHDVRQYSSNNYTENSAYEKKIRLVIKSFMAKKGAGVKC
jgi:hypothetical protein